MILMSIPPLQDPGGNGQQTNPTASSYDFPEAPEGAWWSTLPFARVGQAPQVQEELGTLDHTALVLQIRSKAEKAIQG